jgi:hypothetical protein
MIEKINLLQKEGIDKVFFLFFLDFFCLISLTRRKKKGRMINDKAEITPMVTEIIE